MASHQSSFTSTPPPRRRASPRRNPAARRQSHPPQPTDGRLQQEPQCPASSAVPCSCPTPSAPPRPTPSEPQLGSTRHSISLSYHLARGLVLPSGGSPRPQ